MRVLLLHPDDSPWCDACSHSHWDLVIDLGFASTSTYEEWSRRLGTRVLSIYQSAGEIESYGWVSQVLEYGRGRLLDRMGLDWWEILAVLRHFELQALYLLNQLRPEFNVDQVYLAASRPHSFAKILGHILCCPVDILQVERRGALSSAARMLRSARKLRPGQIVEIAFDKWDSNYRIRRHVSRHKRAGFLDPLVLLPSSYSNVTRSVLAYADQLPHRRFLLAVTRPSALPRHLPQNVSAVPLAAYALPSSATETETLQLRRAWDVFLRTTLSEVEAFRLAADGGFWDDFPKHLENGLRLREAWKCLLECEPVTSVLCGDDLNYYTRLPLILAQRSGLKAVYCSHGALDGGVIFKMPSAEAYLVKGEMESDYLQRAGGIAPEKIWVAAPGSNPCAERDGFDGNDLDLVFFSQPFEVEGGRTDTIYRELLPYLQSVAHGTGRRLIIKLHPFESMRARKALVTSILPGNLHDRVKLVSGPPEGVMARTWCGVTRDSSVAVDCALRGIPLFFCGWLDFTGLGYMQQFARFGVGRVLTTPQSINQIPEIIRNYRADPYVLQRLWQAGDPAKLDEVIFGTPRNALIHTHPSGFGR